MDKSDLIVATKLSPPTVAKPVTNDNVNMDVLRRICEALDVDVGDIMEFAK